MNTYNINSSIVKSVACLMGCTADTGLVNRMNKMLRAGKMSSYATVGDYYRGVLKDMLSDDLTVKQHSCWIVAHVTADGSMTYYTGRAGNGYLSADRSQAFTYESPAVATQRCNNLGGIAKGFMVAGS